MAKENVGSIGSGRKVAQSALPQWEGEVSSIIRKRSNGRKKKGVMNHTGKGKKEEMKCPY